MMPKLISNILNPKFLERRDRYFLLNYPRLWRLNIHYVCWYGLLVNIFIFILTMGFPLKKYQIPILLIIAIVAIPSDFFLLNIATNRINYDIEKQYGNTSKNKVWLEILAYMACITIILSPTLVLPLTMRVKMATIVESPTDLIIYLVTREAVANIIIHPTNLYYSPDFDCDFDCDYDHLFTLKGLTCKLKSEYFLQQEGKVNSNLKLPKKGNKYNFLEKSLNHKNRVFLAIYGGNRGIGMLEEYLKNNESQKEIEKKIQGSTLAQLVELLEGRNQTRKKSYYIRPSRFN